MENLRFEESFQEAFSGAEIVPSHAVWTNVELGLEKTSGGKMRGRLLFFQLLAAASMVFAMGIGGVYFLNTNQEVAEPIAQLKSNDLLPKQNERVIVDKSTQTKINDNVIDSGNFIDSGNGGISEEVESLVGVGPSAIQTNNESEVSLLLGNRPLPRLVEVKEPSLKISRNEPDPGMVLLAKLRDEEKKFQQDKPELKEKVWASLGMGAGTYNPNASASNVNLGISDMASSASISSPASGTSYSVGVSVAGKVSKRVVLQAGISYLTQNSTYTSTTASGTNAFLNEFADKGRVDAISANEAINVTSPYQVNNNLQYISIPVQAGYILIDQAFALQVNGGISTDVFFRNTLTPENSDIDESTQGAGSDSPYRTLNFSGLLGTELSYKIGDHYRIAVSPEMRYALNSIYKPEIAAEISPVTFDVSLRVRYMF